MKETVSKSKTTALVVDDENELRTLLVYRLNKFGLETDEAEGGEAAFALIQTKQYDFLFTDIIMPGMGGKELLLKIKSISHKPKKCIVITGDNEMYLTKEQSADLGIDGYLKKPFTKEEISIIIQSV